MAVRLTLRHRWPRNLGELLQNCGVPEINWVSCRSCRRLRIAVCQTYRIRERRNLRLLLQVLRFQIQRCPGSREIPATKNASQ